MSGQERVSIERVIDYIARGEFNEGDPNPLFVWIDQGNYLVVTVDQGAYWSIDDLGLMDRLLEKRFINGPKGIVAQWIYGGHFAMDIPITQIEKADPDFTTTFDLGDGQEINLKFYLKETVTRKNN